MNGILLFAAPPFQFEWVVPIIVFLVFIIRIIGAAINGNANQNMPNRRPPGQPPRIPQPPQGGENEALKGEIEEFLRRVSNRREGQPQRPTGKPPRPAPVIRTPTTTAPADRRRRPAPVVIATAGTPVLEVVETPTARGDVDDHVKRYLNTGQFEQRAGHLSSIDEKERQFDRQIQRTFAHEVGHLKPSEFSTPNDERSVSEAAPQVIDDQKKQNTSFALLTGGNLINAVIVSEIMNRPEHRW
jgi:hypothetical protein